MSAVTVSPSVTAPAAPPPARRLGRDYWALSDQALISGTNFVTMAVVARALGTHDFGVFTLVYSALLFANMIQSALVTQPHNVLGTRKQDRDYVAYTTSTLLSQVALGGFEAVLAASVAVFARHVNWIGAPLVWILAPSILAWQLQEFVRRVLYTEGRHAAAFFNDLVSYGGQTLWIVGMAVGHELTAVRAMTALTVTSATAVLFGIFQIRRSLAARADASAFGANWAYGKWLAGSEILGWCSSINFYLYLAARLLGYVATGELRAVQILFGPARLLASYLDTVLPIRFARTLHGHGHHALRGDLIRLLVKIALPMTTYCVAAALLARPLLRLAFGPGYESAATVLVLYSGYALLTYFQMILTAALRARQTTHLVFAGSMCAVVVSLPLSLVLIPRLGLPGILLAMIAGVLAAGAVYVRSAFSHHEQDAIGQTVACGEEACPT